MHYPPETTTIRLIVKLLAMHKQANNKKEIVDAIQEFHHEFINENLMISHKMQGENHQRNLDNLYELYLKAFDFSDMEVVSKSFASIINNSAWHHNCVLIQFRGADIFKRLFALIGENGQGIGTSSFADWVKNVCALELSPEQKNIADDLIDNCYAQLDEGNLLKQKYSRLLR